MQLHLKPGEGLMKWRHLWTLAGLILLLYGCSSPEPAFTTWATYVPPQGGTNVIVQFAPGNLPYAPVAIRIYLQKNSDLADSRLLLTTQLANDGVTLTAANIRAAWISDNRLDLCLAGYEQEDQLITINTGDATYVEKTIACSQSPDSTD